MMSTGMMPPGHPLGVLPPPFDMSKNLALGHIETRTIGTQTEMLEFDRLFNRKAARKKSKSAAAKRPLKAAVNPNWVKIPPPSWRGAVPREEEEWEEYVVRSVPEAALRLCRTDFNLYKGRYMLFEHFGEGKTSSVRAVFSNIRRGALAREYAKRARLKRAK